MMQLIPNYGDIFIPSKEVCRYINKSNNREYYNLHKKLYGIIYRIYNIPGDGFYKVEVPYKKYTGMYNTVMDKYFVDIVFLTKNNTFSEYHLYDAQISSGTIVTSKGMLGEHIELASNKIKATDFIKL